MDIKNLIKLEYIKCYDCIENQQQAFEYIVEIANQNGLSLDHRKIVDKFHKREAIGSTGLLDGFAIPHAQDETIGNATIIVLKSKTEILWETLDNQDVTIVFGLLVPTADKNNLHLDILASLSSLLMEDTFRSDIKKSDKPQEIWDIIVSNI